MWKYVLRQIYFLVFLKFIYCCQCNLNHTDGNIEKRELDVHSTTELFDQSTENTELTETSYYITVTTIPQAMFFESNETSTEMEVNKSHTLPEENTRLDNIFDFTENSSEIVEAIINGPENIYGTLISSRTTNNNESVTESVKIEKNIVKHTQNDLWKKCRHYKNGESFNLRKMADVWQVVYYRLANNLKCFKLHIKLVTVKDQKRYARVYGSFNDTVSWNRCFLEITSNEKEHQGRRHFLQGTQADKGIMENVIIDEEYSKNTTYLTLHLESGDQWLVIGNLLVMRDCRNGDFVVFTKVPLQPRKSEIMDALKKFGLKHPNGTMACNVEKSWLKYEEGSFT